MSTSAVWNRQNAPQGAEPETLRLIAQALRAARDCAGLTKESHPIKVASDRVEIRIPGRPEPWWVKTADAALRSLDRIFNGHDPKKLSVAFRKAMPTLSAGEAETKTKSGAKAREKYFRAADAVFDWKLPLRPIELVTYLCFVRHARGSDGRVERLSGEQIARECGMKNERHARRIIAFLVKAGMIKKTFIGGWKGSVKTNEYLVPWLPETFTRELLTAAIKRARKALPGANPVKTKRRGKPSRKATASDADW